MPEKILVVDDDPLMRLMVVKTLSTEGFEFLEAENGAQAVEKAISHQPDLIIMDVNMPELDGYEACQRIRSNPITAGIPIILVTSLSTVEDKIKGFDSGADDYIPKPFDPKELTVRVNVLLRRIARIKATVKAPEPKLGKVIAFFSLRGGTGTTLMATNTAIALSRLWGVSTALVDLVLACGQCALMMNIPPRNSWADLARIPNEEIDIDVLRNVLRPHDSGTLVLVAPNHPEEGELIDGPKVTHVLNLLKQEYPYVILDLPHEFCDKTLAGLDVADEIWLLLAPELASVRATLLAMETFQMLNYSLDRVRLMLNWTFERHGLARKAIEKTLKREIDVVIPYASEPLVKSINLGIPAVLDEANPPLVAIFENLAYLLSREDHKNNPPANPTPTYQRVMEYLAEKNRHG